MINPFIDLLTVYNMQIALPLGIQTYKTTTSNWMWPDNVWHKNTPINPITICNVEPRICPPLANHLPIYIVLNLLVQRANPLPSLDLFLADFTAINTKLSVLCPTQIIHTKMELENTVNSLVDSIQEILKEKVPTTKPCPFMKRWWNNELMVLKKSKNKLSKLAY